MNRHPFRSLLTVILVAVSAQACERPVDNEAEESVAEQPDEEVRTGVEAAHAVGETSREWILSHQWTMASAPDPDESMAKKLADVPPGAQIDIYLGTWCPDSRREVLRFWNALDVAGEVPFETSYVGLNRDFEAGEVSLQGKEIIAVPTFIVKRDAEEVGRVVETSVNGIESDLLRLLTGEASGMISASRN